MRVGDTIWRFDINRRRYQKGQSGPIWREHWDPLVVVGETSRSWLVGYEHSPYRVPKKDANPAMWAFSREDIDRREWVEVHRYEIGRAVQRCERYDVLQQVADLLKVNP